MRVHAHSVGDGDINMQLAEAICTARSHVLCEKLSCRCWQLQLAGSLLSLTFSCTAARPLRTGASSGSVRIKIQCLLYLCTPESASTGNITPHMKATVC